MVHACSAAWLFLPVDLHKVPAHTHASAHAHARTQAHTHTSTHNCIHYWAYSRLAFFISRFRGQGSGFGWGLAYNLGRILASHEPSLAFFISRSLSMAFRACCFFLFFFIRRSLSIAFQKQKLRKNRIVSFQRQKNCGHLARLVVLKLNPN